jgi:hypothetical protein
LEGHIPGSYLGHGKEGPTSNNVSRRALPQTSRRGSHRVRLEFEKTFERTVLDSEDTNRDLYERLFHDKKFSARVMDWYLSRMYELLRPEAVQQKLPLRAEEPKTSEVEE